MQTIPPQQPIAAPVLQPGAAQQQADWAKMQAQQHFPQAPTLSGGMYPTYGDQAVQHAPKQQ